MALKTIRKGVLLTEYVTKVATAGTNSFYVLFRGRLVRLIHVSICNVTKGWEYVAVCVLDKKARPHPLVYHAQGPPNHDVVWNGEFYCNNKLAFYFYNADAGDTLVYTYQLEEIY